MSHVRSKMFKIQSKNWMELLIFGHSGDYIATTAVEVEYRCVGESKNLMRFGDQN